MTGAPADWPMTVQQMADNLLSTGWLYMVVNPGYGSSTVDLIGPSIRGAPLRDMTGSVSLDYATGNFNSQAATKTSDMSVRRSWGPRFSDEFGQRNYSKARHQLLGPYFDAYAISLMCRTGRRNRGG